MSNKYPNVEDDNFYSDIDKIYKKYIIKDTKKTYDDWCFPKKFTLQLPQEFVANFINPKTPYTGLLVYHRIGSGKTCAAVQIGEAWKKHRRVIVVVPASLRGNFRQELRSKCAEDEYLTNNERKTIEKLKPTDKEYIDIIKSSDKRINKYYDIYSFNKFIQLIQNDNLNLENALLIIDEIQNMISEHGKYYQVLHNAIENTKNLRLILLSATPLFDKPNELALTLNLLNLPKKLPISKKFDSLFITKKNNKMKNIDEFKQLIKGFISYYAGAPEMTFPKTNVKYIECVMSKFQYDGYKHVLKHENIDENNLSNNFYIGTRMISNIIFPNKKLDQNGYDMLTSDIVLKKLEKYSCKFNFIIDKIQKLKGKIFIYSNFRNNGGLSSFIKILDIFGYKDYAEHGAGKKRYAIWSGDEAEAYKNKIRKVFNALSNIDGKEIKILLGSSSIKEGVTLLNVKNAFIIDGYWNKSRMDQIMGRVSRYCCHKNLPEDERKVTIYVLMAVSENEKEITIDKYMKNLADKKNKLIKQFEKAIIESSVDCHLNQIANLDNPDNVGIKCDK